MNDSLMALGIGILYMFTGLASTPALSDKTYREIARGLGHDLTHAARLAATRRACKKFDAATFVFLLLIWPLPASAYALGSRRLPAAYAAAATPLLEVLQYQIADWREFLRS